jgi:hypothetical protein
MDAFVAQNPLVLVIAACEVGFWLLLVIGLLTRYVLRRRRASTVILLGVPLLDLVLVGASLLDVAQGAEPGPTHGLAALYLGFTLAFGHATIRAVDVRFAHRFAGGPVPVKPVRNGREKLAHEWREWGKAALMAGVTLAVSALIALVARLPLPAGPALLDDPFWTWAVTAAVVAAIWFVAGPLWVSFGQVTRGAR